MYASERRIYAGQHIPLTLWRNEVVKPEFTVDLF